MPPENLLKFLGKPDGLALDSAIRAQYSSMYHGGRKIKDGTITDSKHGLMWQRAADGVERLYLSPQTSRDGSTAIRGGVPVCFPQFNMRGPLRLRPAAVRAAGGSATGTARRPA